MVSDGGRCRHGEYLVERADTARQGDEHIALGHHQFLAVAEIVAGNVHVDVAAGASAFLNLSGYYSYRSCPVLTCGPPYALHQSEVAAAEHHRMAFFSHPASQLLGGGEVGFGYVAVGGTEYTYFHDCANLRQICVKYEFRSRFVRDISLCQLTFL